jgi:hypothetical protein
MSTPTPSTPTTVVAAAPAASAPATAGQVAALKKSESTTRVLIVVILLILLGLIITIVVLLTSGNSSSGATTPGFYTGKNFFIRCPVQSDNSWMFTAGLTPNIGAIGTNSIWTLQAPPPEVTPLVAPGSYLIINTLFNKQLSTAPEGTLSMTNVKLTAECWVVTSVGGQNFHIRSGAFPNRYLRATSSTTLDAAATSPGSDSLFGFVQTA